MGQLDAAKEKDCYAIGVDSDQAMLFKDTDPEKAELILTSMLKRIDNSLVRAVKLFEEDKLPFGTVEVLGLAEEAVGLAKNEFYERNVPQEIKDKIEEIEEQVKNGDITVSSAFDMSDDEMQDLLESVRP